MLHPRQVVYEGGNLMPELSTHFLGTLSKRIFLCRHFSAKRAAIFNKTVLTLFPTY
jgi:hypothetical protein